MELHWDQPRPDGIGESSNREHGGNPVVVLRQMLFIQVR
jgi:hypothetical protein